LNWYRSFVLIVIKFSRTVESEYESCNSGFTSSTDDNSNDDEKIKYSSLNEIEKYSKRKVYREKSHSLSRSDSGVSLNTNKQQQINLFNKNLYSSDKKSKSLFSNSIISSIFDGKIQSQIECLTCYRKSTTIETFQDLSLPIPSREQLEVSLLLLLLFILFYFFRNFIQYRLEMMNKCLQQINKHMIKIIMILGLIGSIQCLKSFIVFSF
jgi:hypothetical protein